MILDFLFRFGWWAHEKSKSRLFSWVTHALLGLPFVPLVIAAPWTAPGAFFLYRELEQVWHRFLRGEPLDPVDHVMDVAAPGLVGWGLWALVY